VFQRLRGIKQLDNADIVYMGATHSRLEHSNGVATAADRMCQRIMDRQPYLGCTVKDQLCVKIAGLTHDIGHGPFSHVYEVFVKKVHPGFLMEDPSRQRLYKSCYPDLPEGWQHESTSLMMIDLLLEELGLSIDRNHLDKPLKQIQNVASGVDPRARVYGVSGLTDTEAILTSRHVVSSVDHRSIWDMSEKDIAQAILSAAQTSTTAGYEEEGMANNTNRNKFTIHDFFIVKNTIHHGCKERNPVSRMHFLEKSDGHDALGYMVSPHTSHEPSIDSLPEAFKVDETDYPFPSTFQKNILHVYSKTEDKRKSIGDAFKRWWSKVSNVAKGQVDRKTTVESSMFLEDDCTSSIIDCTSKTCSNMLASSQPRILTQDDTDSHHNLEAGDMPASVLSGC
jgi:HD domain